MNVYTGCLELELRIVMNHQMDSGNQTWVLCKGNKCSTPLTHLYSPKTPDYKDKKKTLNVYSSENKTFLL